VQFEADRFFSFSPLDLGFDLTCLQADLLPLVPLFGRALLETGTDGQDFVQLAQRIGRDTGGIRIATFASSARNSGDPIARLFMRGKATLARAADLFNILGEVIRPLNKRPIF